MCLPVREIAIACGFLSVVVAMAATGWAPWLVPSVYVLASAVTFLAYGIDKHAAEHDRWRTPESTLHLLAVAGGWPGALVARRVFRHKTLKQPFRAIFWATVIVNVGLLALVLTLVRLCAIPG